MTPQIGPVPSQVSGNDGGPLSEAQTKPTPTEGTLNRPDQITHDHVGQYCIVLYDEKLYPGEIRDIVSHGDAKLIEVKCMGRNKLF